MTNRPAIPSEIVREILIESGHRCAVCGTNCPLERAHIVPWHQSKEHRAEDLICLCANCHERADKEGWGEKTLREYKKRPWVMRQHEYTNTPAGDTSTIQLIIDMEVNDFDERNRRLLQHALAGFLQISPDAVRIKTVEKGSVKVTVELPSAAADRLLEAHKTADPKLRDFLEPFHLESLSEMSKASRAARKRILVVEDDDVVRELMRMLLEQQGFEVETAEDGLRGYELALQSRPDLIIADLQMPAADGVHLVRRVRNTDALARTPVLIVTGMGFGDAAYTLTQGADAYVPKPLDAESLIETVRRLLS